MAGELDFDEFYDASFRRVVGQVYAMVGSLSGAEDAVQEAFARAWQHWSRISDYGDPEAWVRSVAFKISVSAWRKAANRFTAHRRQAAESDDVPGLSPDRLAIVTALQKIAPELRQVIVLHHLLGLSVAEICAETGVPSGTVKARLVRGRKALAPHLSEFAPEAADGAETTKTRGGKAVAPVPRAAETEEPGRSAAPETSAKEGARNV
ncbi:SigE family RNA polymerase sigma factor [Actinospica durhamensis]|uniref:SigE family RNA polymerase sigma factor n=1 Tax=Actinospica durhamensis TaxID=1508375 RepID=A0A941IPN0_9ACTN|nr:SigE family RNA polymerase sigma factor [Actinospica durhamensis]MBR7835319.1 SigE family RNA polymerase sigma factor [Actinospica durhamensis]